MKQLLGGVSVLLLFLLAACSQSHTSGPPVIDDLGKANYHLINQDSAKVNFSQDFKGKYTILAFIYTHCPFMCPLITGNMGKIQRELGDTTNVQFVEITFDPKRDTPARLRKYMASYHLNMRNFQDLTGDSTTIARLMKQAHIKYFVNRRDTTKSGKPQYFFKHTNRIEILDKKGRVRYKYPGSVVPAQKVIQDLKHLQSINDDKQM
jgi:protein SCO1/2